MRAIDEIDRLTEILSQFLDVAEAHAGALRMNPRPIDLENLLTVMSELYQPCMNEKALRLELRILGPVTVQGDPALLHRAVTNLFDNELNTFLLRKQSHFLSPQNKPPQSFPSKMMALAFLQTLWRMSSSLALRVAPLRVSALVWPSSTL